MTICQMPGFGPWFCQMEPGNQVRGDEGALDGKEAADRGGVSGGCGELLLTLWPLRGRFRFEGVDSRDLGWKRTVCLVFMAQEGEGQERDALWSQRRLIYAL